MHKNAGFQSRRFFMHRRLAMARRMLCAVIRRHGINDAPMVNWVRGATQHPYTQDKYSKLFVISADDYKVFDRAGADNLAECFNTLAAPSVVEAVKVDSMNPARSPPVPR